MSSEDRDGKLRHLAAANNAFAAYLSEEEKNEEVNDDEYNDSDLIDDIVRRVDDAIVSTNDVEEKNDVGKPFPSTPYSEDRDRKQRQTVSMSTEDRDRKQRQLAAANIVFRADGSKEENIKDVEDVEYNVDNLIDDNVVRRDDVHTIVSTTVEKHDERIGAHANNPTRHDDISDAHDTSVASVLEYNEESTFPSSLRNPSEDRNNIENADDPTLSVAHPVKAFLFDDTVVVDATAISNNSSLRPYHVIAATLTCLVIVGIVVGLSVTISSSNRDDIIPTISPTASPTANINVVCFESTAELRNATAGYLEGDPTGIIKQTYGTHIGSWCVDKITDFSFLFCAISVDWCTGFYNRLAVAFDEDISMWNTSLATNMSCMFGGATSFNQDISSWDVSSVNDMSYMFSSCKIFDQDISSWTVFSVRDMSYMFSSANSFNQDISSWNVSSVTTMNNMFGDTQLFNQDISSWNVSSVKDMAGIFSWAVSFDQSLSSWDVSSVTDITDMFFGAYVFNQDISSWNVSSVKAMTSMFYNADLFDQDISKWDVSSVRDMRYMFSDADSFNQDISSWNVSSVKDMSYMFSYTKSFNQDISSWNVASVTDMSYMFNDANSFNHDISLWDVSSVTDMTGMFANTTSFNQSLCNWGSTIQAIDTDTVDMFVGADTCLTTEEPNLTSTPPGPFCHLCM